MSFNIHPLSFQGLHFNQYHVLAKVNNYILPVLIDTGSSISCIQSQYCTFIQPLSNPLHIARCFEPNYIIKTSTIVHLTFDNNQYYELSLLVHDPTTLDIPIVLGISFLDALQSYTITYEYLFLTINEHTYTLPRIFLSQQELKEQLGL